MSVPLSFEMLASNSYKEESVGLCWVQRQKKLKGRCKDGFPVRAYIPALNDGVLRANLITLKDY